MVVGVRGQERAGSFEVEDICFPDIEPPPTIASTDDESWVAIVSGLSIGKSSEITLQLLSDYITGEIGDINVNVD